MSPEPMPYLPVFLDVAGRTAVLVGEGPMADAKAMLLQRAGAVIRRVMPSSFVAADLDGAVLVIDAGDDDAVTAAVRRAASARRIPVNVVDRPALCDFIVPAILERGPITVAISTGGIAPGLARLVRQRLETVLPLGFGRLATFAGTLRGSVKQTLAGVQQRQRFWDAALEGRVADLVLAGREAEAGEAAAALLAGHAAGTEQADGGVWLVGAGPGDPDLLTVAAVRAIQRADVILYDHLVGTEILELARREAMRICVGKRSGRHLLPQSEICRMLGEHALAGRRVVRLKGGDPMLFGRAGEELDHLHALGVAVTVIPGVTAALGCAASAGISLTRRGVASSMQFVTAHRCGEGERPIDWHRLADPDGTLAIYMGREQAVQIRDGLLAAGMAADTPALAIENGTRTDERRVLGTLATLPATVAGLGTGPTLLLVGRAITAGVQAARTTVERAAA